MKTIGMLGGMSWQSTALYYQRINQEVNRLKGGLHSASILLHSVDFAGIEQLQQQGLWHQSGEQLGKAAYGLEQAGADFIIICTNTMHKVAEQIQQHIQIPLLHLAVATAQTLQAHKITKVGLLGTSYTMEQAFYKDHIAAAGIEVVVPPPEQRNEVNRIIFEELCLGEINDASRDSYIEIINDLHTQGAQGVIAGCTEITLLIQQAHSPLPLFDTTAIHIQAAVAEALR